MSTLHEVSDGRGSRRVFLDGVQLKNVYRADTVEGWVEFYVPSEDVIYPTSLYECGFDDVGFWMRRHGVVTVEFA